MRLHSNNFVRMLGVYIHIPPRVHTRCSTTPHVPVAGYKATVTVMGLYVVTDSLATRVHTHTR